MGKDLYSMSYVVVHGNSTPGPQGCWFGWKVRGLVGHEGRDSVVLGLVAGCGWLWENLVTVTRWCLGRFVGPECNAGQFGWYLGFDYWVCVTIEVEPGIRFGS